MFIINIMLRLVIIIIHFERVKTSLDWFSQNLIDENELDCLFAVIFGNKKCAFLYRPTSKAYCNVGMQQLLEQKQHLG